MKDKIIAISIPLFDEKGYSETSIQDIVDQLGVTKGTFYYYYNTKQKLLRDIILSYMEKLLNDQEKILTKNTLSNKEKLFEIMYMIINNIRSSKQSARIFTREMRHIKEKHLDEIKNRRRQFKHNLQKILEAGIEAGEFRSNIKTEILSLGILGIINWTYYWYDPDGAISEKELTEIFMNLITDGIKN